MPSSLPIINIAILDLDNTAQVTQYMLDEKTVPNDHPQLMNKILIDKFKQENYVGFYACTHRCASTAFEVALSESNLSA